MKLKIHTVGKTSIAELISSAVEILEVQDALDLMGEASALGARSIVVRKENLIPDFFNLRTGIAGEILQKFSTYSFRLAIVGDLSKIQSRSLQDFIFESNKTGRVLFLESFEKAITILAGRQDY